MKKRKDKTGIKKNKITRKRKAEVVATGNEVAPRSTHDPKWDLETMTRAEEIRSDKKRHGAVKKEAKNQRDRLHKVMRGPADEMEMRRYASAKRTRKSPMEQIG